MSHPFEFSTVWLGLLREVLTGGQHVAPRGKSTLELPMHTIQVDMRYPVLTVPTRKLSYQFMAAEAYWILSGDNRVASIAPYNARIAEFSDDGETFFGAYGPKIYGQLPYVIDKLLADPSSRQAGLTTWRECPPVTKDVPCTVAMFFDIRNGLLNMKVFMRSSDIWLGVPYDVFNFSMLGHLVCAQLNERRDPAVAPLSPGHLYLTAASSHLYEINKDEVIDCLGDGYIPTVPTPELMFRHSVELMELLRILRGTKKGDDLRWWEEERSW